MSVENHSLLISVDALLEEKMCIINSQQILFDYDLAMLFNVSTKQLIRKVQANRERFPDDFMFELTGQKYRMMLPVAEHKRKKIFAFSLGGILQAAGLFRTARAVAITIQLIECIAGRVNVFDMLAKLTRD